MGFARGEAAERLVHTVTVSGFEIDRYEVSNGEFAEFVDATGHVTDPERSGQGWHWNGRWHPVTGANWRAPHGSDAGLTSRRDHPVVQVSWNDARAYCEWRQARLPTEAEWERAARGSGDRLFAWGDEAPQGKGISRAGYGADECCRADDRDGHLYTAPVGSFPLGRSPFGIEDMTGNVWEWVQDSFDPQFYARSSANDPINEVPHAKKVIRGGGWGNNPWGLRATLRHANPPDIGLSMVGFRCAR
jgi:formylglycine-generating enzyme required for sulfatase activity